MLECSKSEVITTNQILLCAVNFSAWMYPHPDAHDCGLRNTALLARLGAANIKEQWSSALDVSKLYATQRHMNTDLPSPRELR
jgi:hypothetical protein